MQRVAASKDYVDPIHAVWAAIGAILVVGTRYAMPYLPEKLLFCPSVVLFGVRCPACGAATALVALSGGRLLDAIAANPLLVIGGFVLAVWGVAASAAYFAGRPLKRWSTTKGKKAILRWGLVAAIGANWLYEIFVRP